MESPGRFADPGLLYRRSLVGPVPDASQLMGTIPKTNSPLSKSVSASEIGKKPVESCSSDGSACCEH